MRANDLRQAGRATETRKQPAFEWREAASEGRAKRSIATMIRNLLTSPSVALALFLPHTTPSVRADDTATCNRLLCDVADTYGVEIVRGPPEFQLRTPTRSYDGNAAPESEFREYVPLLVREVFLYPIAFIKQSGLNRVVLCHIFRNPWQRAGGLAVPANGTIYLNTSLIGKSRRYVGLTFHHELFHLIDYEDDRPVFDSERWSSLNRAGFKYGAAPPADVRYPDTYSNEPPGFVTRYALSALREDKAETFSNLVMDGAYVERRATNDPILATKVTEVKRIAGAFCAEIDESFWQSAKRWPRPQSVRGNYIRVDETDQEKLPCRN